MREEKDMIEINLNAPAIPEGKQMNYFDNIRLAKSNSRGFPYGHYENETDAEESGAEVDRSGFKGSDGNCAKYASICGAEFTAAAAAADGEKEEKQTETSMRSRSMGVSCLRQMYCPECQQRLDADSVRFEKMLACCLPLFPLNCVYQCCLKRQASRKKVIVCNKCGNNLGYWKRS